MVFVALTGLTHDEVKRLMHLAQVGVICGVDDGALAILTEHMLAGLPVIANALLPARRQVGHGSDGAGRQFWPGSYKNAGQARIVRSARGCGAQLILAAWSTAATGLIVAAEQRRRGGAWYQTCQPYITVHGTCDARADGDRQPGLAGCDASYDCDCGAFGTEWTPLRVFAAGPSAAEFVAKASAADVQAMVAVPKGKRDLWARRPTLCHILAGIGWEGPTVAGAARSAGVVADDWRSGIAQ